MMRRVTNRYGKFPGLVAVFVALLATSLAALALAAGGEEPTTTLVSRVGASGPAADGNSTEPSISLDGRYVAFASRAKNLSPAAKNGKFQIYARDLKTGAVTLVSRASGSDGAAAENGAREPSISSDGRYVAFTSSGESLSAEDAAYNDVFVRDLATATTTFVSRATGPAGPAADSDSYAPSISVDGRHVAFESGAANLSAEDLDNSSSRDVFVRDLDTGVTELISRASGVAGPAGSDSSHGPSISANGNLVAFSSRAPLGTDDLDQESFPMDVFVRDRAAATTTLVSRASGPTGAPSEVESDEAAISADGAHVAFASSAKLTGQRGFFLNVFVRDLATATTRLVSVGDEGAAGDGKRNPAISADGRFVAFETRGNKVSPTDADGRVDVFARDMQRGVTVTLSRASGRLGVPADAPAFNASVSGDGSRVAFDSRATNLSGADLDELADVFVRHPVYAKEPKLPTCAGRIATVIGTPGKDSLEGTKSKDVIVALGGDDRIKTFTRADVICAGPGDDLIDAGDNGEGGGSDLVLAGPGNDKVILGPELGRALGEGGADVLLGSKGGDSLSGGPGNDLLRGGPNPQFNSDFLYGGPGNDRIYGGPGPNYVRGGPGRDLEVGGNR
jgi:Tol biopolymer transport system component